MIEWADIPLEAQPEELGVSQWVIPSPGQQPFLNSQMEEPIAGPVEFRDKVQVSAGWVELLLPYALSTLIMGSISIPSILHQSQVQRIRPSTPKDELAEVLIVPDLQPPHSEPTISEPIVFAVGAGPTATIASPPAAAIDQPSSTPPLPLQPPEPVIPAAPSAPTAITVD